jgi:hypothetical protein
MESEISFAGIAPATPARPPFLTQSLASDSVRYGPPPGPSRTCLRFYILVSRQPRTRPLSLASADQRLPELSGATFSVLTLSASEHFCVKLANVAQLCPALTNDRQRLSAPNFPFNAVSIQRFLCEVGQRCPTLASADQRSTALSGATSSRRLCAGYHGTMMTRSCTGPDDSTRRANA